MPAKASASKPAPRVSKPSAHPVRDAADALHRAAIECCHQHDRLSKLNSVEADEAEFNAAWDVAEICETHLAARTDAYEDIAQIGRGTESEDFWRAANGLWAACREYVRRHAASNGATAARKRRHGAAELNELAVEYELELSARMAVKQALEKYGAVRATL